MIYLILFAIGAGLMLIVLYACLVVGSDADDQIEADDEP
jgi:xanthosine utilization system XapX-like protein